MQSKACKHGSDVPVNLRSIWEQLLGFAMLRRGVVMNLEPMFKDGIEVELKMERKEISDAT